MMLLIFSEFDVLASTDILFLRNGKVVSFVFLVVV